ncbi:toprim domain-containing protein [Olivibacter sp. XZL3]|uniref:toprim domain-containing protein n=1 Tax=Olivibacter sp. XZL3 TaxID=1735116 RepID=UPI00141703D6|nr:toprim domain-containing protein [Olivibacter sp. XZL3]
MTTLDNGAEELYVFEGFFDFLSLLAFSGDYQTSSSDFLILNSLSFFEGAWEYMEKHRLVNLFLDRDETGRRFTGYACSLSSCHYDRSALYEGFKDLNEWLASKGKIKQNRYGK